MSDDLVKRLREGATWDDDVAAANRIEELEAKLKWADEISNIQAARLAELEAKLAKAVEMLEREIRRVQKIQRDFPPPHTVGLIHVEAEYELMLAELKGQDDEPF